MTDDIECNRRDGVQIIRIVRPDKKNALTQEMYRAMSEALAEGDKDDGIAVHVILGSEGIFSAGNDVADFLAHSTGASGPKGTLAGLTFIRQLPHVAKPMLAGVDGAAIGVGTTLLFHCDLVYATERATFATPFLDLGLVPEAGSSLLMPERMGYARAFEMLVLGEVFSAERMREAGLVNAIVAADQLEAQVLKAAAKLAAKPPEALSIARQLMRGDVSRISERTDKEAEAFVRRLSSGEAKEAFEAFLQKRAPDFKKHKA